MTFAELEAFQRENGLQLRVRYEASDRMWHAELYSKGTLDLTPNQHQAYAARGGWLDAVRAVIKLWSHRHREHAS